jgi:pimeloyl-ACP methyl ester carboxylesterase
MRRLLIDGVMVEPLYREVNLCESQRLGDGAWNEMSEMIYNSTPLDPTVEFGRVVEILKSIQGKRWTKFLHLDDVLAMLGNLPPQAWEMAKAQMRAVMNVTPAHFLTKVRCPVLAIFGEKDTSIPVEKSVALYKQYLRTAGNDALMVNIFPDASHTIHVGETFVAGYFDLMVNWLSDLYEQRRIP